MKRATVTEEALERYAADVALAEQFDELFAEARSAEGALRDAQVAGKSLLELNRLAKDLDAKLTAVMRAAFAAQRAEIGPRGYEDRIFRRKAMATSPVRTWTMEAQRLLTLRESHRLTGIPKVPRQPAA